MARLPCKPRDKKPLLPKDQDETGKPIKGTGGVTKASCDPAQIRAWWQKWPNAMIGIAMGRNGLFALDFDPRNDPKTGEEWTLDRLKVETEQQIGLPLPVSLAVPTPSGGVHVYFGQPTEGTPIRNRGNLPDHVDVRGEGEYVIAPPSMNHVGGKYRWLRNVDDAPIEAPPAKLVEELRKRTTKREDAKQKAGKYQPRVAGADGESHLHHYCRIALASECDKIAKAGTGKRQDALNGGAFAVAQLVATGYLPEAVARSSVEHAGLANPGNDDEPQIIATIDSGWAPALPALAIFPASWRLAAVRFAHPRNRRATRPMTCHLSFHRPRWRRCIDACA